MTIETRLIGMLVIIFCWKFFRLRTFCVLDDVFLTEKLKLTACATLQVDEKLINYWLES